MPPTWVTKRFSTYTPPEFGQTPMSSIRSRVVRALVKNRTRLLDIERSLVHWTGNRGGCLFVTCFPKSGSTLLVSMLEEVTGYVRYFLGADFGGEHDLYLPRLLDAYRMSVVSHHHMRCTPFNLELAKRFDIRPVILVRPLADCLVSLRDHLHDESSHTPTFSAQADFFELGPERQMDCLVDLAAPWYIDFYRGWADATTRGDIDALWLTYDELTGDRPGTVSRVLEFCQLFEHARRAPGKLARFQTGPRNTRFNKGISGRGRETLSADQQDRLTKLFEYWPSIDFSIIS